MCPVCTVTVIAGLGISRILGINDFITSLWIGGFILSFSFITIAWIEKAKWNKHVYKLLKYIQFGCPEHLALTTWTIFLMYLLVIAPLYLDHTIGIPRNTLWSIDKIILGISFGSIMFLIGIWADKFQRKRFKKIFFPFQKVAFPVLALIISSLVFYFVTKH